MFYILKLTRTFKSTTCFSKGQKVDTVRPIKRQPMQRRELLHRSRPRASVMRPAWTLAFEEHAADGECSALWQPQSPQRQESNKQMQRRWRRWRQREQPPTASRILLQAPQMPPCDRTNKRAGTGQFSTWHNELVRCLCRN